MEIDIHVDSFTSKYDQKRYPSTTMHGIFKLEKQPTDIQRNKLTWCFAMPGDNRPTSFTVETGSNHKLIKLDRFDETDALTVIRHCKGRTVKDSKGAIKSVVLDRPSLEAINALKALRRLKCLSLGVANESIVKQLSGHPTLKELKFKCSVSAELLDKLTGTLPKLEKLDFSCNKFTSAHGKAIAKSKALTTLFLSHNSGDYSGFRELKNSSIHSLRIEESEFPLSNIELIRTNLDKLKALKFYGCDAPLDRLPTIDQFEQLASVDLVSCSIDDKGKRYLQALSNPSLPQLIDKRSRGFSSGIGGNF